MITFTASLPRESFDAARCPPRGRITGALFGGAILRGLGCGGSPLRGVIIGTLPSGGGGGGGAWGDAAYVLATHATAVYRGRPDDRWAWAWPPGQRADAGVGHRGGARVLMR